MDSLPILTDSLFDTTAELLDTTITTVSDLSDSGITDSDFFVPILYILSLNFAALISTKIPFLNKITDTKLRTIATAVLLGLFFSLSFQVSILQLALAYGVATGIVYDFIIKKVIGFKAK